MIVVRVEVHSANTGAVTEIARMHIANQGGMAGDKFASYIGKVFRGRSKNQLDQQVVQRHSEVTNFRRKDLHVWKLVAAMLNNLGYAK